MLRAWCFTQIATWALVFKQRGIAFDYYDKILAESPRNTKTLSCVAFLHAEAGDRARAIAGFERVVAIAPDDANSWFNLGYLQQEAGNHDAALVSFGRSLAINDKHDRAWFGQALSLVAQGQLQAAVAPLKKNCELQPMSPHGHMELARVYFRLGDTERCEKRMRKLRAFDPRNAATLEDETGIRIGIERWWKN